MEIKDITGIIGSFLSAASILFAVYTYKRNEDRNSFARFRLAMVDYHHFVKKLDAQLSEPVFNEIAFSIAHELQETFTTDISVDDLIAALKDDENKANYARQAIHQGIRNAPAHEAIDQIIESLDRLPIEFSEQFPVVSGIISKLNFYANRSAIGILSPKVFNQILCNRDAVEKLLEPELRKAASIRMAYLEVGILLGAIPRALLEKSVQATVDDISALVQILVTTFSTLSDAELRVQSKRQKNLAAKLSSIDHKTAIEDAFEYFKLLQETFVDDWDHIVEAKTRLYENSTKKA